MKAGMYSIAFGGSFHAALLVITVALGTVRVQAGDAPTAETDTPAAQPVAAVAQPNARPQPHTSSKRPMNLRNGYLVYVLKPLAFGHELLDQLGLADVIV